jgi:apolipoprotein D and lipocalin family protein
MPVVSIAIIALLLGTAHAEDLPPLQAVPQVELNRYLGKWYEIGRLPNSFQRNCDQATAEYSLRVDGEIEVLNTCIKKSDGAKDQALGRARIDDNVTKAKLIVSFLPAWLRWTGIGSGKYWIIDLGREYEYAVVSEPSRKYLWILSRTPLLPPEVTAQILSRLRAFHFDTSLLIPSREGSLNAPPLKAGKTP